MNVMQKPEQPTASFALGSGKKMKARPGLAKALEAHVNAERAAEEKLIAATGKGLLSAKASTLADMQLQLSKARAGSYWKPETEKRLKAKLQKIVKANEPQSIALARFDRPGAEGLATVDLFGRDRVDHTMQQSQPAYDMFVFDRDWFGYYNYDGWHRTGEGRIRALQTYQSEFEPTAGGYVSVRNPNADDSDYLSANADSGIWFTYHPKATGHLDMLVEATVLSENRFRDLQNEFGNSHCTVKQMTELVVGTWDGDDPVGRQYVDITGASTSLTNYSGNGDGAGNYWPQDFGRPPGSIIRLRGRPGAWAVADRPVDMLVGCKVQVTSWLNDVSLNAWQLTRLKINFVGVRVLPG